MSARSDADDVANAPAKSSLASPGLMSRLGRLLERDRLPSEADVRTLFTARQTDVAANKLAARWVADYGGVGDKTDGKTRRAMLARLSAVSAEFGADDTSRADCGVRFFKRLNAQDQGLRFLVSLRADMLRWKKQVAGLQLLDRELEGLLSNWFDVGLLDLRRLTWDSPASLLEKLIVYEAVHEITSWSDLRHRVAAENRRCYAFFHPRMPEVPLIFVEVAFTGALADNVQAVLDFNAPDADISKARWAIFYSISNTQPGLRGISFGNFLLKRVIDELVAEKPKLRSFATLSPMPGFADWLSRLDAESVEALVREKVREKDSRVRVGQNSRHVPDGARWVEQLRKAADQTVTRARSRDVVKRAGLRLAAHYLQTLRAGAPADPVARFHLGNGARIERVNWAADTSDKGIAQACGMMVNYVYELDELDDNLARLLDGQPRVSREITRLSQSSAQAVR